MNTNLRRTLILGLMSAALSGSVFAQQDEKLGKLTFPTSCDSKVQADFERGVAMLHSFWFLYARKTFESVLQRDPNCAIAHWGIAVDLLGNTLATTPTRGRCANGPGRRWRRRGRSARRRRASATGSRR